jgi:hypothetical protein
MTLDELKTLLALNGNQRILHLESEIFSNEEIYTYYINKLVEKDTAYYPNSYVVYLIYYYIHRIIRKRWPEAEDVIATNRSYADKYNDAFGTNI